VPLSVVSRLAVHCWYSDTVLFSLRKKFESGCWRLFRTVCGH